jgi:hypothetical protein
MKRLWHNVVVLSSNSTHQAQSCDKFQIRLTFAYYVYYILAYFKKVIIKKYQGFYAPDGGPEK